MRIANTEVGVLTQPERRRRWSDDQKRAIVAEMLRPGASATRVARRHGISTGLLYTWRRWVLGGAVSAPRSAVETADFVPVRLVGAPDAQASAPSPEQAGSATGGEIVIELIGGRRLRVDRHVDAEARRRVLRVLDGP